MQILKSVLLLLVPIVLLSVSGCGSSSSGTASVNDPFSPTTGKTDQSGAIFGNISTADGITGITLTTDRSSIDVNNGQVVVTATVVRNSAAVPGVPVNFTIKAPTNGPAAIEAGLTTVTTDSNGVALTRVSAGDFLTTTNIIVQATVAIGSQTATTTTTFQLVRGNGVIMFTDLAGKPPGAQSNMLEPWEKKIFLDPAITSSMYVDALQLIPFKVTDSNGNPRVGVPITLSVYSISRPSNEIVTIDFLVPFTTPLPNLDPGITETNQRTITTDSAGMGIFNVRVRQVSPPIGSFTAIVVVYKATTNDAIPVTAYVGGSYSITAEKLP
jgi:hypothetical protein